MAVRLRVRLSECCEAPTFECPISSPQPVKSASLFLVAPCLPSRYAVEALSSSMNSDVRWLRRSSPMTALGLVRARAELAGEPRLHIVGFDES